MNKALSIFDTPYFGKLTDQFIGFDDFFNKMDNVMNEKMDMGFPPYDIYTEDVDVITQKGKSVESHKENHTFIKFALAGIPKDELRVKFEDNVLYVYNEKKQTDNPFPNNRKNIRLGIAQRSFSVSKTISKDLELVGAKHEDGCLIIEFRKKEVKPKESSFVEIQ